MNRISHPYGSMIIILLLFGSFELLWGKNVGLSEVQVSGLSGFIFSLIPALLVFGYEDAKKVREDKENAKRALEAIRSELELNLQYLGSELADADASKVQLAPDRLMETSFSGVSSSGFLSLLTAQQQQIISSIYHKVNRAEMFSDYAVMLHASKSIETPFLSQQIVLIENSLRTDIPDCIQKISDWLKALENDKKKKK